MKANGFPVISGSILMPRRGAWVAKLELNSTASASGAVVIDSLGLTGTIVRGEVFSDRVSILAVAGKGGLQSPVAAKGYQAIPISTVVGDILSEVGETLDPSSTLSGLFTHWARRASTAEQALSAVAEKTGLTWRVLASGNVWFGTDTYTETALEYTILERKESEGWISLGVEAPTLVPPFSLGGRKVETVQHCIEGEGFRTVCMFGGEDRVRSAVERVVKKSLPHVEYLGQRPAKVVSQNADGTLELVSDDLNFPNLSKVKFRYGTPGIRAKVDAGSRCFISYDSADPSKPSAGLFDAGTLSEWHLTSPVVKLGDASAAFIAHSAETISALNAIAGALQTVGIAAAILGAIPGSATHSEIGLLLGPLAGVPASISSAIATLPTTKVKAT